MKNFTLLAFIVCCFAGFNAQGQCSATIGYQHNPNSLGDDFWVDNYFGDTANTDFSWQFCDGTADAGISVVHPMPPGGGFLSSCLVCLTVYDRNTMCTYNVCDSIVLTGNPNNNCAAYATYTNADSLYTFFASYTGGNPVVYEWKVNGIVMDTTPSFSMVVDSNTFPNAASVCIGVTDANGCFASDCVNVGTGGNPVFGGPCQAYFVIYPDTGINSGGLPGYYKGDNRSTGNYGSNILWDFGDGTTSTDPYPIHNYAAPGSYIVCLTVGIAGTNCYDTYCDSSFYVFKTEGGLMSHLDFSAPTGIDKPAAVESSIRFYPNPVSNEIKWEASAGIEQVRIFDLAGHKVLDAKATGNRIDVTALSNGVYFLRAIGKDGKQIAVNRFVKGEEGR